MIAIMINVGIVGYGLAGEVFHAPIINSVDNLNLSKIVSSRKEAVEKVQKKYPDTKVIPSFELLLEDPSIDLVVIGTPNTCHFELAKRALMRGKHVVVEKPFTVNSRDSDELIELSRKIGKILTVNQNRRWDSDFLTVKKIIEKGFLGSIVEYEAHFDRFRRDIKPNAWREDDIPGSGMLYDLGSHLIDQAQCLFGLPNEIYCDIDIKRNGGKVDDYFEMILYYESVKVILKSSMLAREPLPHFTIHGDKGSYIKYGMDVQENHLKSGYSPLSIDNWGEEPSELWGTINTDIEGVHFIGKIESEKGNYRTFYENVYRAILGEEELIVKPREARNTIRIIELALESNKLKSRIPYSSK